MYVRRASLEAETLNIQASARCDSRYMSEHQAWDQGSTDNTVDFGAICGHVRVGC